MIAIIDYDAGNLKSVEKALVSLGEEVLVSRDSSEILQADKVILPGVGSFGDAMNNLDKFGLVDTIKKVTGNGTPFLGICLGLQLLFKESDETPGAEGLDILPGKILKIPAKDGFKIPHMGWNSLDIKPGARLFKGLEGIHTCILYILIILRQQMRGLWQQLRSILHIFMLRLKAAMCLHASSILKRAVMSDLRY